MPKPAASDKLKRFTETVLAGRAKSPWPWALLKDHFPGESDYESRQKLEAWADENAVDVRWEEEQAGRKGPVVRVVVFEPRRRPAIRSPRP